MINEITFIGKQIGKINGGIRIQSTGAIIGGDRRIFDGPIILEIKAENITPIGDSRWQVARESMIKRYKPITEQAQSILDEIASA